MMLWLRVSVIKKNKAALDTQKRRKFRPKCVRMRLAAWLRPDPLGELKHSPRPSSRNPGKGVPTSNFLRGRERKEMGKGKEGMGRRQEGKGGPPSGIGKMQGWQP